MLLGLGIQWAGKKGRHGKWHVGTQTNTTVFSHHHTPLSIMSAMVGEAQARYFKGRGKGVGGEGWGQGRQWGQVGEGHWGRQGGGGAGTRGWEGSQLKGIWGHWLLWG